MPENYKECSKCEKTKWVVVLPEGPICPKCLINISYGSDTPEVLKMEGFIRYHYDYFSRGKYVPHTPYRGDLHSLYEDKRIPYRDNLYQMLSSLPEGVVVEIIVKIKGHDDRPVKDPIVWYASHKYEILSNVPDEEKKAEIKRLMEESDDRS